tara:strand:+ start:7129 stop:9099 length:1971 start_codon:yes stop_codon:yes gene_type:complete
MEYYMEPRNNQEPSKQKVAPRTLKNRRSKPRRRQKTRTKAKKRVPKQEVKEVVEEESPVGPMDHQLIERITLRNTMGDDVETLRGDLERLKERGTRFKGMSPSDEDKYEYGRRYTFDNDDIYNPRYNIPKRKIKAFKKNREAFMDIHRREYERIKEKELRKGNEVDPYPRPIEVEDDILQKSFMPEYLYIPEKRLRMKDEEEQFKEGMKILYKEGETPPELYKINERMIEEEMDDNSEDGYLHSPDERKEIIDHYNKIHTQMVDKEILEDELSDGDNIEEFYEKKIKYYENPTILGCMKLKEMLDKDPSLYRDKKFAETYITPCRDNKLLTEVFINNFDNVLPELIMAPHVHIKDYLTAASESRDNKKKYPDGRIMYGAKYFPPIIVDSALEILGEMGLYVLVDPFYFRGKDRFPGDRTYLITPCNSFYMLALNFKYMKKDKDVLIKKENINIARPGAVDEYEADGVYIKSLGMDGIDALKLFFDKLEERYMILVTRGHIPEDEKVDIEQTKRFFILLLLGVKSAHRDYDDYYIKHMAHLEDKQKGKISTAYTRLYRHYKGIPDSSEYNPVTKKNEGRHWKMELKRDKMAHSENILQVSDFIDALIKEYKELFTIYISKRDNRNYDPELVFDYYGNVQQLHDRFSTEEELTNRYGY